jgi:hypothetical protein
MMPDSVERLVEVGRRVLRLARPPVTLSATGRLPYAYEDLLLDPMVALSDSCGALLERSREPSPAAERARPTRDPDAYLSPLSRATWGAPRDARGTCGSRPDPRIRDSARALPGAPAPGSAPFGEASRAMEPSRALSAEQRQVHLGAPSGTRQPSLPERDSPGPAPRSEDRGPTRRPTQPEWPEERWTGQGVTARADNGTPSEPRERGAPSSSPSQGQRHGLGPPGAPPPTPQPAPEARKPAPGDAQPAPAPPGAALTFSRRDAVRWAAPPGAFVPEDQRPFAGPFAAGGRASSRRESAEDQRIFPPEAFAPEDRGEAQEDSGAGASSDTPGASWLAASTERLAAMLRANVAASDPEIPSSSPAHDAAAPPSPRAEGVGRRTATDRGYPDGRVDLDALMERLAEELEDGIARTYGSSGG